LIQKKIHILSGLRRFLNYDISLYGIKDWLSILTAQNIPQAHYIYHLWFIVPYLIISCTFDIQKKLISKIRPFCYVIIIFALQVIVQLITDDLIIRSAFCYNIFMVVGFLYYKKLSKNRVALAAVGSWSLFIICIACGGEHFYSFAIPQVPS